MKFSGIAASLALAGAVSAAAIPRDTTLSNTVDGVLNQVNTLLNQIEPAASNAVQAVDGTLDLSAIQDTLNSIKEQLGGVQGLLPALPVGIKRGLADGVTGAAGSAVGTVESAASPVVNTVEQVAGPVVGEVTSTVKRDVVSNALNTVTGVLSNPLNTVDSLVPLANNLCSGIQNTVPLTQTVTELTALTQGLASVAQLPLALVQLPSA
ncbi:hypothetical protein BGW36DRAFT_398776 [Talaromyces proteolyticus]|uniref:Uncharacterized protein n=1 Tax=Talaromyces proteolyticus TaxID=1131652 RepID=A0AAD4KRV2_9EURO|nr:uncharacterized protein BGW36DRAFT_398776 [Talaromyces proteolyticus]KAH8695571.1 hypothetical protein BGW36DRAFT_398776 [Talaromyces proteolyticus]